MSEAALAHLDLDDLLTELLDRIQVILDVDTVAILLLDPETNELAARAAKGLEEEVKQGTRIPLGKGFAGRIAAERRPIAVPALDSFEVVNPLLRQRGICSLLGVPLLVEGVVIGVLHVGTLVPREFGDDDTALLQLVGDRVALAIEHARLFGAERQARRAAEAAAERLTRLQALTDAALAELSIPDLLDELLVRIRDLLGADTATVLLLDVETAELVATAAKGLEEEVRRRVRIPLGKGFAGRVAAESRPVALTDVGTNNVINPILLDTGIRSLLGVPLLVEGVVIGVLHVGMKSRREFSPDDSELLQLAADRMALAIDRARLYEAERDARAEAERAAERIGRLSSITEVALSHLAFDDDLLNEMLVRVRETLGVDTSAVLLLDEESNELVARAAKGLEEEVERGVRIPVGGGFAGKIAATAAPVILEQVHHNDVLNPILLRRRIKSLLGVPLLVEGRVIGVLHVGSLTPRVFSEEEVTLLEMAADRIAVALDHSRLFEREHLVAATLQRSLLPEQLPTIPGIDLAARYLPGAGETSLGGDWYDAMVLPSGDVGIAMGDVVRRGLRAASAAAQLRNALRAYAFEGYGPAMVMSRLSRMTRTLEPREMATLLYMVLDPATGSLVLTSAGHPPPLVLEPDGSARFLDAARSVPLGALAEPRYEEEELQLEPGSLLLAYTDGLVERRNLWMDEGMERLRRLSEGAPRAADQFCAHALGRMLREAPTNDDVAMLAVKLPEPERTRLALDLPADAAELSTMRRALRRWLDTAGAADDEAYEILVATTEAAANAVEHAYGPGDADFWVEATLDDDTVAIAVRDKGNWRPPRGTNRGRGTMLMQQLMDTFDVSTGDDGTVVRMTRRLGGGGPA